MEYIYAAGQRVATISGGATTYHYPDHLSTRESADSAGKGTRSYGHFPFGETWYEMGTPSKLKFTTYERDTDSEGGLDYANARFYSPRIGRFMSLDPLAGTPERPQTQDLFPYVENDPINSTDPSGLFSLIGFTCLLDDHGNFTPTCIGGFKACETMPLGCGSADSEGRDRGDSTFEVEIFTNQGIFDGHRPEGESEAGTWIGWVERNRGFFGSILRGRKRGIFPSAVAAVHGILSSSPLIRDARWHFERDLDKGNEERGPKAKLG